MATRSACAYHARMRGPLAIAAVVTLACACAASDGADRAADAEPAEATVDPDACPVSIDGVPEGAVCVLSVEARVVDETGAPIPGMLVTACGDGCSYGDTDADGRVRIDARRYMRRPAFQLHGRSRWASYYVRFEGGGHVDLGTLVAPRMPASSVVLPTEGQAATVTSGDVTLSFPAGAEVVVDTIELSEPSEQAFSTLRVPLDQAPPWARSDPQLVALYAIGPFATNVEPGARARIANVAALEAGTPVELWVHGTSVRDTYGPFGGFAKMADAKVTDDGAAIESDSATPIRHLTWLGVRRVDR